MHSYNESSCSACNSSYILIFSSNACLIQDGSMSPSLSSSLSVAIYSLYLSFSLSLSSIIPIPGILIIFCCYPRQLPSLASALPSSDLIILAVSQSLDFLVFSKVFYHWRLSSSSCLIRRPSYSLLAACSFFSRSTINILRS